MYDIEFSATFKKQFKKYNKKTQSKIKEKLEQLKEDPFTPRVEMNITSLTGTKPLKHRLKVGGYRVVYCVFKEENIVKLIETFPRGRGYRGL